MTLAECLVALIVSLTLIAAVDASLVAGQRSTRALAASRGLRQNLRASAAVLRAELEAEAPGTGDLLAISDSDVVLRAQRIFGIVCAIPAPGLLVLDDSLLSQLRAADPARDSALVFREGDELTTSDDRWIAGPVTVARRGTCAGGAAGTLIGVSAPAADLAGIGIGAPVRVFEIAQYRRYRDAAGLWWLGVRTPSVSGWSATSPIAGPLAPVGGLVFTWRDAALGTTAIPDSAVLAEARIRVLDQRPFAPGPLPAATRDSALIRILVGGP